MSFLDKLREFVDGTRNQTITYTKPQELQDLDAAKTQRLIEEKRKQVESMMAFQASQAHVIQQTKPTFADRIRQFMEGPQEVLNPGTPTSQPTQLTPREIPQKTSVKNPYADWTKEQLRADIRPEVADYLDNKLIPMVKEVPPAIAASQWAIEGGRNVKANPFGLMRNNQVLNYGDIKDNIRAYEETVKNIVSTNMGKDVNLRDLDPETILHFLQFQANGQPGKKRYEAHMPDPQSYIDMIHAMPEWRYYSR